MPLRRYDLPLQADGSSRFLPWFIGLMVYLATLALAFSLLLTAALDRWDAGLRGSLTVQVPAPADGSPLSQAVLERILGRLRETVGVVRAEAMDQASEAALLKPWLGTIGDDGDLPLPVLIDVRTGSGDAVDTGSLQQALAALVPGTIVATHDRWLGRLFRTARLIALSADLAVSLIGAGAVLTIIFTTRTGLLIHHEVIELLHLVGAQDSYIARQFQAHAFRQALRGGIYGTILALTTLAAIVVAASLGGGDVAAAPPGIGIALAGWLALPLLPVIAGAVALVTARVTVLRVLGRMS
jgi:cell division transport system permease protein